MIAFAAKYRPVQMESPPPKTLYADAEIFAPCLVRVLVVVGMKRLGSKSLEEGPQTEGSACSSAEGTRRMESFFKRYWFSRRVSLRTIRPEAFVDWRRRVSWTTEDNRGVAVMMSGMWASYVVPWGELDEMRM